MSRYDELQKLYSLKDQGVLSEEEFEREKQRLLDESPSPRSDYSTPPPPISSSERPWGMDVKVYCMLLHLSQFIFYFFFPLGIALPIVMWVANKDRFPKVDAHGRVVLNWTVSGFIYALVFFILSFVFIGIPLLIAVGICAVVFPIIGAVRANDGVLWRYPLSIRFFG